MKKSQLIQYGIIVTGVIFGYKFFESIFSLIAQLIFDFQGGDLGDFLIRYILITGIYLAGFIVLVRSSGTIATRLVKDQPNEHIPVKLGKQSVLNVVLIVLALTTLLSNLADTLTYLFESFKKKVGSGPDNLGPDELEKLRFRTAAIQTIAALVILYFHREISKWFLKKQEANELIFESEEEKR